MWHNAFSGFRSKHERRLSMCGIAGFIGKSKDPRVSFDLMNALMVKTEIRGDHATGFWATEHGDGAIFFDKEAIKSSQYINRSIWKKDFADSDCDLVLGHCRQSSAGVGGEKTNRNNHPHASDDRNVALVHNGRINDYNSLKNRYQTTSECDSEVLLRMFESAAQQKDKEEALSKEFPALSPQVALRMTGLKEIFARVNYGAMAVAIGERMPDDSRYLWLLRDDERPLHVVDMRDTLGQLFFCSTPDIWEQAASATPTSKDYVPPDQKIVILPPLQVWAFIYNPKNEAKIWQMKKFIIRKERIYGEPQEAEKEDDKRYFKKLDTKPTAKIISRLDKTEDVIEKKDDKCETRKPISLADNSIHPETISLTPALSPPKKKTQPYILAESDFTIGSASTEIVNFRDVENLTGELDMNDYNEKLKGIKDVIGEIESLVYNKTMEGSFDQDKIDSLVDNLNMNLQDLNGTVHFLKAQ